MPKVSDAHRERRRGQILTGARRCFAQNGYERTTVRQLEAAIGLSTGAIFSYYPSKLDLFVALASEDAERAAAIWREGGLPALVRESVKTRHLSASYLELGRRVWSDPAFRRKWSKRGSPLIDAIRETVAAAVAAGEARTDLPPEVLVDWVTVVLDGLMLRVQLGMLPDELDEIIGLYEQALRGPTPPPPARRGRARRST